LPDSSRAFAIGVGLNLGFVALEIFFGLASNSLSLLADAGHNFGDVLGLLLAWGATAMSRTMPSMRWTYGLRGTTILAALGNAMLLLVAVGIIVWEALGRFSHPESVASTTVIWVALAGVLVNGATALMFVKGRKHDLNLRGAYLHMVADAAISLGVAAAGVGMLFTGWSWLDPVVSITVALFILVGTSQLLSESFRLAVHAVPTNVEPAEVRQFLAGLNGVAEVHDLHIWGMSTTEVALTAHLVMPGGHPGDDFFAAVGRDLAQKFQIVHPTLQIETGTGTQPCALAPDHVV
jgi:cobalt-zinc-cadmium efflux system protein